MKSEPDVYSIDDLERDGSTHWDGIRNYQARNTMRDDMQIDDMVLFYHSNAKPPGVAGVAKVCKTAYPDHTQFDAKSKYFDGKSDPDDPRWLMVDIEHVETFPTLIGLDRLRQEPALDGMPVLQKGQRLSVQPVEKHQFEHILGLARSA